MKRALPDELEYAARVRRQKREARACLVALLKQAFPKTKFFVRVSITNKEDSNYTFEVSWRDGPTAESVRQVFGNMGRSSLGRDQILPTRLYSREFYQKVVTRCARSCGIPVPIVKMTPARPGQVSYPYIETSPCVIDAREGEISFQRLVYRQITREAE